MKYIYYEQDETITIVLETKKNNININAVDVRIEYIIDPNMKRLNGFPVKLYNLDNETGVYIIRFKLPENLYGTYICMLKWNIDNVEYQEIYCIILGKQQKSNLSIGAKAL